jgi:mono/diheme cytochrome c family protein
MSRLAKILVLAIAAVSVAAITAACGTEKIDVPKSQASTYSGAVLFSQRCAGCHTLDYAGTHGSAPNIRTAQAISGPNFNVRCERPVTRVLYAIENGGFSGAYMPQNIVVGQDARNVATFVATYAGRKAPKTIGLIDCQSRAIGTLPAPGESAASATASASATGTNTTSTQPATGPTATPKSKKSQ